MSEEIINDEEPIVEKNEDQIAAAASDGGNEQVSGEETAVTEPTLEEQLEAAKAEAAKNLDGWMRVQAEFANARKRMDKQRVEIHQRATADMAAKLLPVVDDFERAIETVPEAISSDGWFEGIQLVYRKLTTILEGMNVKVIEAVGQPFDPNHHEAIMQEASEEYESGIVTRELQKGYMLGDRVIRPSLVYVAE
ncbi:MAG: nucleotide exchange factor GrpE [Ardenticatenaceae bacterium]|nr:nucleotide exchange factor GrpE [Anaerolineales bacterium]MCB8985498.1 nucleotide exchange factor GrpE [Ardenticatenaceae bacterium]